MALIYHEYLLLFHVFLYEVTKEFDEYICTLFLMLTALLTSCESNRFLSSNCPCVISSTACLLQVDGSLVRGPVHIAIICCSRARYREHIALKIHCNAMQRTRRSATLRRNYVVNAHHQHTQHGGLCRPIVCQSNLMKSTLCVTPGGAMRLPTQTSGSPAAQLIPQVDLIRLVSCHVRIQSFSGSNCWQWSFTWRSDWQLY